ncbi:MAG TPA: NADH-quinone oxidoreductase subunit J [Planctomycetaceae bacterium]|nr:NADH-quinone oxidoreductase subunit J [Planctomycetaceae bacterium]
MNVADLLFWLFAAATCGGAIGVVLSQNVVRMAFWLMVSLGSVAGLFFLLSADFLGAAQLLIYVGGTVVLLIFGVMLTASGPYLKLETRPTEVLLGLAAGVGLLGVLVYSVGAVNWRTVAAKLPEPGPVAAVAGRTGEIASSETGQSVKPLGLALLGVRADHPERPGYLLPFEVISVHLLIVLIGAGYLARAKRRVELVADRDGE